MFSNLFSRRNHGGFSEDAMALARLISTPAVAVRMLDFPDLVTPPTRVDTKQRNIDALWNAA